MVGSNLCGVVAAYEQAIVRTMFFKRNLELDIDGNKYIVSNAALLDHYKCKELIT